MKRVAFKMQLNKGAKAEYKKYHNELWPESKELLKSAGVKEYSIFLDETTNSLFGILEINDIVFFDNLPQHPVKNGGYTRKILWNVTPIIHP